MPGARERLFVGVPLPESLRGFVQQAQQLLPQGGGLRLLREEQWHVTLAFLGSVEAESGRLARQIVEGVPEELGGQVRLGGFLMLPSPRKARVVTLAIDDEGGIFAALFETVMTGLESAGVTKREKRPFRPHLTVARLRVPALVQPKSDTGRVAFAVESVCLYKSELRREGAKYTVLTRKMLSGAEKAEPDDS